MPAVIPLALRWVVAPAAVWFGANWLGQKALDEAKTTLDAAGGTAEAAEQAAIRTIRSTVGPIALGLLVYNIVQDK
jgi:hypothetical protein